MEPEGIIATSDRGLPVRFLGEGLDRSRAVGRITLRSADGTAVESSATGFLVAPDLLVTCAYVIPDAEAATRCQVEFDYVEEAADRFARPQAFALEPGRAFVADAGLGFTIVAVAGRSAAGDPLAGRPFIPVDPRPGKLVLGEEVNVIHHGLAAPLSLLIRDVETVAILDDHIHFVGQMFPGAGGAPVLNDQWELVGIFYASADGIREAIRISRVLDRLLELGAAGVLATVLAATEAAIGAAAVTASQDRAGAGAASAPPVEVSSPPRRAERTETFDPAHPADRDSVFLCYARDDQGEHRWKDRLDRQLRGIARFKEFTVWHDGHIEAGVDWRAEIDAALRRSGAAVLLIGPSFLTSDFIQTEELPALLRARAAEGIEVLPLITDFCAYRHSPLARFQSVNDPQAPLESLAPPEQNRLLLSVAEQVAAAFERARDG